MKVHEAVANAFVKEGTSVVFGLMGDGQMPWWASMAKFPQVKIIDVREEGAALAMAEAYAMTTGRVGVASCTQGPGLTRMFTSLVTATRSRTPIVVLTARPPFHSQHGTQEIDQDRVVGATGAGYIDVLKPDFAEDAVREAFYSARVESRPYVLCLPHDVQGKDIDADGEDYQPSSTLFAGRQGIRPDVGLLDQAARLIAAAKKPVVLLGRGGMDKETQAVAERLAGRTGALIATSLLARGTLAQSEYYAGVAGLFASRKNLELLHQADCVIALGASLNMHTLQGGYLFSEANIIQIDVRPNLLMGNEKRAHCYIQADACIAAGELDELLASRKVQGTGFHTAGVRKVLAAPDEDKAQFPIEPGTMDPRPVLHLMNERLGPEVVIVHGTGHSFSMSGQLMSKPRERQIYITAFGCIGQTFPASLGAAVAREGKPVVMICGDGGAMQNIQELETAARLNLKLLFVIMNDETYGSEFHKLITTKRDPKLSIIPSPDFATVARGFGCRGKMARSLDEVSAGLEEFLGGDGPMLLDCRISRNVISIAYRRMTYGEDV